MKPSRPNTGSWGTYRQQTRGIKRNNNKHTDTYGLILQRRAGLNDRQVFKPPLNYHYVFR